MKQHVVPNFYTSDVQAAHGATARRSKINYHYSVKSRRRGPQITQAVVDRIVYVVQEVLYFYLSNWQSCMKWTVQTRVRAGV